LNIGSPDSDGSVRLSTLERHPQSVLDRPQHLEGTVLIRDNVIAGPPVLGQMIRKVAVDDMPPTYHICDPELREPIDKFYFEVKGSYRLPRDHVLHRVATIVQQFHIDRPKQGHHEIVSKKLMLAQAEIKCHYELVNFSVLR
jgi:hypothetical protein